MHKEDARNSVVVLGQTMHTTLHIFLVTEPPTTNVLGGVQYNPNEPHHQQLARCSFRRCGRWILSHIISQFNKVEEKCGITVEVLSNKLRSNICLWRQRFGMFCVPDAWAAFQTTRFKPLLSVRCCLHIDIYIYIHVCSRFASAWPLQQTPSVGGTL